MILKSSGASGETSGAIELSVIAPCYNERENVAALTERTLAILRRAGIDGELVLVDDGSMDGTWKEISRLGEVEPRVRGVRHPVNRGIEAGWRSGLGAARGRLVCLIDADLQNRPEDVPRLFAALARGDADMAQGVRNPSTELHRHRIFTRGLNWVLNTTFGSRLRDGKSGFLMCRRETLRELLTHRYVYRYFQSFIGAAAVSRGLRIAEVDTVFEPRLHGQSFLSRFPIAVSLRIVWELCKFRVETWGLARRATSSATADAAGCVQA